PCACGSCAFQDPWRTPEPPPASGEPSACRTSPLAASGSAGSGGSGSPRLGRQGGVACTTVASAPASCGRGARPLSAQPPPVLERLPKPAACWPDRQGLALMI